MIIFFEIILKKNSFVTIFKGYSCLNTIVRCLLSFQTRFLNLNISQVIHALINIFRTFVRYKSEKNQLGSSN